MERTIEQYKEECERLEGLLLTRGQQLDHVKNELQALKMKIGTWRCLIRQVPDAKEIRKWILETPETWEPNVKYK